MIEWASYGWFKGVNVLLVALDRAKVTKGLPDVVAIMENEVG